MHFALKKPPRLKKFPVSNTQVRQVLGDHSQMHSPASCCFGGHLQLSPGSCGLEWPLEAQCQCPGRGLQNHGYGGWEPLIHSLPHQHFGEWGETGCPGDGHVAPAVSASPTPMPMSTAGCTGRWIVGAAHWLSPGTWAQGVFVLYTSYLVLATLR